MRILKNVVLVFSSGYILFYFSELLFWARVRPNDNLAGWLMTWIAYSLLAFAFLWLVSRYRVSSFWPLFLAGACFGWLAEGLLVQTTYEDLPLSISFTGLAWHALLSVGLGWGLLPASLGGRPRRSIWIAALTGLGYGLWAICWWLEPDGGVSSLPQFALHAFISAALYLPACFLLKWSASEPFHPSRGLTIAVGLLYLVYFLLVTLPAAPVALLLLPALLGLAWLGLRGTARRANGPTMLETLAEPVPLARYLGLLALPVAAVVVYAAALALDLKWQTNWLLYLITTPAGFILFITAWVKSRRMAKTPG